MITLYSCHVSVNFLIKANQSFINMTQAPACVKDHAISQITWGPYLLTAQYNSEETELPPLSPFCPSWTHWSDPIQLWQLSLSFLNPTVSCFHFLIPPFFMQDNTKSWFSHIPLPSILFTKPVTTNNLLIPPYIDFSDPWALGNTLHELSLCLKPNKHLWWTTIVSAVSSDRHKVSTATEG